MTPIYDSLRIASQQARESVGADAVLDAPSADRPHLALAPPLTLAPPPTALPTRSPHPVAEVGQLVTFPAGVLSPNRTPPWQAGLLP